MAVDPQSACSSLDVSEQDPSTFPRFIVSAADEHV
jgi:hypothetical protein